MKKTVTLSLTLLAMTACTGTKNGGQTADAAYTPTAEEVTNLWNLAFEDDCKEYPATSFLAIDVDGDGTPEVFARNTENHRALFMYYDKERKELLDANFCFDGYDMFGIGKDGYVFKQNDNHGGADRTWTTEVSQYKEGKVVRTASCYEHRVFSIDQNEEVLEDAMYEIDGNDVDAETYNQTIPAIEWVDDLEGWQTITVG